jgi:hypothetical protein
MCPIRLKPVRSQNRSISSVSFDRLAMTPPSARCSSSTWPDGRGDAVHRVDRVEIVGRDDQRAVGVLQRGGEAAADHVAEHVEDHDVGVFQQVVLFQSFTV